MQISSASTLPDGFFGIAYEDPGGNIVMAFEGTNASSNDAFGQGSMAADKTIAFGGLPQAVFDAASFSGTVRSEFRSLPIYVTGHSLGGLEAEYVIAHVGFIAGGCTFAAPGFPYQTRDTSINLTNYVDKGDAVGNFADDTYSFVEYVGWVLPVDLATGSTRYHAGVVTNIGSQHAGDLNNNAWQVARFAAGWSSNITDHSLEDIYYPDLGYSATFGSHPPAHPPRNSPDTVGATISSAATIAVGGTAIAGTIDVLDESYDITRGPSSASLETIVQLGPYAGTPVDKDWYQFSTTPGATYTVNTHSAAVALGDGTIVNAISSGVAISIRDLSGAGVTDVTGTAEGSTASLTFTATGTSYYVAISAAQKVPVSLFCPFPMS